MNQPEQTGSLSAHAAHAFAERWKDATNEKQEGQSFWRDFFVDVLGISDIRSAGIEFEKTVASAKGTTNFIDCYWKNTALIEHKSAGKDLDVAEAQAREYIQHLPPAQRPPVIIVSDFARIRLVEIYKNQSHEFKLKDLPNELDRFEALMTQQGKGVGFEEVQADTKAAELMAALYQEFEKSGYTGHEVSVFLVRVLFILFGEDTRMFQANAFTNFLEDTHPEGRDLGGRIQELFQALNTPKDKRPKTLDELVNVFPYVNGGLFAEQLPIFSFSKQMRQALLNANAYNWHQVNPSVFGSMFQEVKSKEARRAFGEHYTSEKNILKVIRPLFLDEMLDELEQSWDSLPKLKRLHQKLGLLRVADMACGCGNFLVVAYKQLRQVETKLIARQRVLDGTMGSFFLDGTMGLQVHLGNFYGVEIEEWSSQIATVAMFLADHQENLALEEITGAAPNRFPISDSAKILYANALELDWETFIPKDDNLIILGNPPFVGTRLQTTEQKQDQAEVWENYTGSALVDFVSNWFVKSARHICGTRAKVGLVSTNSITQGDQPAVLYEYLKKYDVEIDFAHRTFSWSNEASGQAAVHCVITGFSSGTNTRPKYIWDYPDPMGEPVLKKVKRINAYLTDGQDILVKAQRKPLSQSTPIMTSGNKPRDGGFLSSITVDEANYIKATDPIAAKYLKPLVGADELINGKEGRFCLWLVDAPPSDLKSSPVLQTRIAQVLEERQNAISSKGAAANRPALFEAITQPKKRYLAVPSVSSERREYVPVAYLEADEIMNNRIFAIEGAPLTTFAFIESKPFTVWVRTVSSRMKSDYMLAASAVYNTFPFPTNISDELNKSIEEKAQEVLDTRSKYPTSSLADLYDPLTMPLPLRKAHDALDKAVLKSFGLPASAIEPQILEHLLSEYSKQVNGESLL
jgi:type I restriction-modification system DNA methylase subunit